MSDKDRPWTADDIRRNAPNWSLQCDGKLLEYMKNVSKTIEERGNRSTHNMHSSMLELDRTKIALENATNQLMALQHKQFIENRVYDDDETLANVDSVPTTNPNQTEQPKMSVTEALQNAITTGMQMVDKYFDKVTIELSDSEDEGEEVQKSVIFRPKNLYEHRPLPYLIGSKDWHEKWHIGLVDEDSDGSGNENIDDEASISSSASSSSSHGLSISSNVPVSLSETENRTGATSFRKPETQDLFQSSSEENISKLPHEENNSTFHKQSVDTSKIESNVKSFDPREKNTNNSIFRQQKSPNVSHVIPTLIDSDPPDLDDISSTRTVHRPANLFLDDENDPDDFNIFDDKTTKGGKQANDQREHTQNSTSTINQIKSINLFADDEDDNFDSFLPAKSKTGTAAANSVKSTQKITNLFDDDDDDDFDDELFLKPAESAPKPSAPATIFTNPLPKKDVFSNNLFNDEPPDDDFDIKTTAKVGESANAENGLGDKPKVIAKPEKSKETASLVESKKPTNLFNNQLNLFDDDDEDDAFEKLIASTKNKKPIEKNEILFESEDKDVTSDLIDKKTEETKAPEIQSNKKSNLFNPVNLFSDTPPSDDDDEQLFGGVSSPSVKKKPTEISKHKTEFYNDFSDTVTAPKSQTLSNDIQSKSPSYEKPIGISSEKSSCHEPEKLPNVEPKTIDSSETDGKRSDFLKKLDAFANPSSNIEKTETATAQKARQPKKLNIGNIDINVAALLPGAKLTKSTERNDSKESTDEASDDVPAKTPNAPTTTKILSEDNVDDSGRLTNLNRNRAKNLSRRPSTRAGRRQQYQKSIQIEEQAEESSDQTDKSDRKPEKRSVDTTSITQIPAPSKIVEDNKIAIDETPSSSPTDKQKSPDIEKESPKVEPKPKIEKEFQPKSQTKKVIFDDDLFEADLSPEDITIAPKSIENSEKSEISIESQPSEPKKSPETIEQTEQLNVNDNKKKSLFSFLDDQDDEYDDFLGVQQPKVPAEFESVAKSEVTVKATPAYIDELPPELDQVDDKSYSGKTVLSENALSLFGEDDDDDDDDDFDSGAIFSSEKSTNPPALPNDTKKEEDNWSPYPPSSLNPSVMSSVPNEKKPSSGNASSLFDDNSDTDELFGSPPTLASSKIEPTEQKPPSKSLSSASVATKSNIFGDYDDEDDLFGEPPPLPEPVKQTQPKKSASKIFGSDSSDDELFGSGRSKKKNPTKSNSATNATVSKAAKDNKASDKLFSDSEDDDLFGTKSKPKDTANKKVLSTSMSRTVTAIATAKEDAQKTVKTLSPSAVDNDPLADLLK